MKISLKQTLSNIVIIIGLSTMISACSGGGDSGTSMTERDRSLRERNTDPNIDTSKREESNTDPFIDKDKERESNTDPFIDQ